MLIACKCDICKSAGYTDEHHTKCCKECASFVCQDCAVRWGDAEDTLVTCIGCAMETA